jgi:hypothetical protein
MPEIWLNTQEILFRKVASLRYGVLSKMCMTKKILDYMIQRLPRVAERPSYFRQRIAWSLFVCLACSSVVKTEVITFIGNVDKLLSDCKA